MASDPRDVCPHFRWCRSGCDMQRKSTGENQSRTCRSHTRHGRVTIAENEKLTTIVEAVSAYIARRLVEALRDHAVLAPEQETRNVCMGAEAARIRAERERGQQVSNDSDRAQADEVMNNRP